MRVFTARVSDPLMEDYSRDLVRAWCRKHIGHPLDVTNRKDFGLLELWADRAVQVVRNRGQLVPGALSKFESEETERRRSPLGKLLR